MKRGFTMKKIFFSAILATGTFILSGCMTIDREVAIVQLQTETAKLIGLASSDDLTISNVVYGEKSAVQGQNVTYRATTTNGRIFECKSKLIDGMVLLSKPMLREPLCKPIKVHE